MFRAKLEHVFGVLKCMLGYRKVGYRGIARNGESYSRRSRWPTANLRLLEEK